MPIPWKSHPDRELFRVNNSVLVTDRDLYWEDLGKFKSACNVLLNTANDVIKVDLSAASFISSDLIGGIGGLVAEAVKKRKKVVIRVSSDTSWIFEVMGSQGLFELEIV